MPLPMTFVTAAKSIISGDLASGRQLRFERFQIADDDAAAVDRQDSLGLEAGKVAGNQFADGPDLRRQFLIVGWKHDFDACGNLLPFALRQPEQVRPKPMPHRSKRKLLDDP